MKIATSRINSQKSSGKVSKGVLFGCGGCLTVIIIGAIAGYFIFKASLGAIKEMDVYKTAVAEAVKSPEVIAALGEPITNDLELNGFSVVNNNGDESAKMFINLTGPKGSGKLQVDGHRAGGEAWHFDKLIFIDSAGQSTSLAEPHDHDHEEEAAPDAAAAPEAPAAPAPAPEQ